MPDRPHHTEKMHRCVEQVMAKGHDESSAYAICTNAFKEAGNEIIESSDDFVWNGDGTIGKPFKLAKPNEALNLNDMDYDQKKHACRMALESKIGLGSGVSSVYGPGGCYIVSMNDDEVIYCVGDKNYKREYRILPSGAFEFPGDATEVVQEWVEKA